MKLPDSIGPTLAPGNKQESSTPLSPEASEWKRAENMLRAMMEGTARVTGVDFFNSLAPQVAKVMDARFCFVAECLPDLRARSLAWWIDGKLAENFEYDMRGTPCLEVAQGRTCHYPDRIPELFPEDKGMIDLGTVSYLGVPLRNSRQQTIGHLVVFDDKPMPEDPLAISVLETFAGRAGAELERLRAEAEVRRLSEELAGRKIAELEQTGELARRVKEAADGAQQ